MACNFHILYHFASANIYSKACANFYFSAIKKACIFLKQHKYKLFSPFII
ncbi:hypothetical protein ANACAC_02423 [Anaerostipes caccae L1-92]|uniref:Uncharacterized protein n=1 Tax=Anaerostipes caccae (strain DSM 14662 / CCUG 47493 / JCM 13470 / NCIMB 13811 / L1-92) TaxID=411490 RepID=B0MF88_ANACD|nr:hypothetical protein ANACAC_02423 [Anaerostipes caccae L1-92]